MGDGATSIPVTFTCNGRETTVIAGPDRLLIDALREDLGLTGTKLGCGTGDCGACTVLIDGEAVTSCLVTAVECAGREVETIEGVARSRTGARVVDAFVEENAVQCGICTPGFVVAATALLREVDGEPSREQIEVGLAGNLCRCTGYFPIIRAVQSAAREKADDGGS